MKKTRLGQTDLFVSKIGFGGIPITRVSKGKAVALVRKALDSGINFIDTAVGYTDSEEKIGAAISGRKRKEIILATKAMGDTDEKMSANINQSLRRLGVDYIDLYQLHGVNNFKRLDAALKKGGSLEALKEAKEKGKVKHIGITTHSLDVAEKVIREDRFVTVQFPFNFVTFEPEKQILPLLKEHPVGVIVMKPFAGGMIESADLVFRYFARFPELVPIPGFETEEELDEAVRIVETGKTLTPDENRKINELRKKLGMGFCRRCGYCMPCPQEITIPLVLNYPTFYRRFPEKNSLYEGGKKMIDRARTCSECGECEEKCPYNLPIRAMLKESITFYEKKLRLSESSRPSDQS